MKSAFTDLLIADGNNINICIRNIQKSNIQEFETRIENCCNAIEEYKRKLNNPSSLVVKKGIRIADHLLYVATFVTQNYKCQAHHK